MHRLAGGLAATALALTLAACGGASKEQKDALNAACQKIDKLSAAACECQTDILAGAMDSKQLEIYVLYRTEWAANNEAYNSVELGEKAAMAKFNITQQEMNKISNEASLKYRKELKECEAKT